MSEINQQSATEQDNLAQLKLYAVDLLPKFGPQWNDNSLVTMRRQTLSRILYYQELYKQIINVPGVICEFGVQWGSTLSTLINLRGIYEPFNASRKIIGFDSFEGFLSIDEKDGDTVKIGDYTTLEDYENSLEEILTIQESFSPLSHIKRFEIVKGDVTYTVPRWLEENPHVIISMIILDLDLYQPTKSVLEYILPYCTKGSVIVFDELCHPKFPGETIALQEVLNIDEIKLCRSPLQSYGSWIIL